MAGLELLWHLAEKHGAALARGKGAAVTFPLVETYLLQQCTQMMPRGPALSWVHFTNSSRETET